MQHQDVLPEVRSLECYWPEADGCHDVNLQAFSQGRLRIRTQVNQLGEGPFHHLGTICFILTMASSKSMGGTEASIAAITSRW